MQEKLDVDLAVRLRYSSAATEVEPALCCPVEYRAETLEIIPQEVLERDYGCGDPTPHVRAGETVLDLGSGGGKLCFIAAQLVGPQGKVIGVDCNLDMLTLARKHAPTINQHVGGNVLEFRCGRIQDLKLDLERLAEELTNSDTAGVQRLLDQRELETRLRRESPMVPDASVDVVISNCVLNLVDKPHREELFREIYRVLKPGGRAAISDIVSDEPVPTALQHDPELWSGCISGAWQEVAFLEEFAEVGFQGMHVHSRQEEPWRVVQGIEFRSETVVAYKGLQQPDLERNQAVIYRGPFQCVQDDEGCIYERGQWTAVSDRQFQQLQQHPYAGQFYCLDPQELPAGAEKPFEGTADGLREPRAMKGTAYRLTTLATECCSDNGCDC